MILRRGAVVEMGATAKVFANPTHPYTKRLLSSVPQLHHKWEPAPAGAFRTNGDRCVYHELCKDSSCESDVEPAALAEVDDDHLVGCAWLGN